MGCMQRGHLPSRSYRTRGRSAKGATPTHPPTHRPPLVGALGVELVPAPGPPHLLPLDHVLVTDDAPLPRGPLEEPPCGGGVDLGLGDAPPPRQLRPAPSIHTSGSSKPRLRIHPKRINTRRRSPSCSHSMWPSKTPPSSMGTTTRPPSRSRRVLLGGSPSPASSSRRRRCPTAGSDIGINTWSWREVVAFFLPRAVLLDFFKKK